MRLGLQHDDGVHSTGRERATVAGDPTTRIDRAIDNRVVGHGLGDDTGTIVVWADGVARWVSDSGDLDVWMIDDEINDDWVC